MAMDPPRSRTASTEGKKVCIYRVPQCLRGGGREQNAYIPQIVSIGPYHHKQQRLIDMKGLKVEILHRMLSRTEQNEQTYLDAIRELEPRARGCYDTSIDLASSEFVLMMMLDGCFVLEFLRSFNGYGYSPNYPIFASRPMKYSISRDLIMLENQIPLFILNSIWKLQQKKEEELVFHFLSFIKEVGMPSNEKQDELRWQLHGQLLLNYHGALHCLDLFRRCFVKETIPRSQTRQNMIATSSNNSSYDVVDDDGCFHFRFILNQCLYQCCCCTRIQGAAVKDVNSTHRTIPSVTKLKEVGMEFERTEDLLWEIDYENGVLKLPVLRIDDISKYLFVNLIAFEQCHLEEQDHITSYLIFMDNLINTSEDVSQLTKCKIIEHLLGSDDEVATLFNTMGQGVTLSYYSNTLQSKCNAINKYYRNNWNTWCAKLKRKYFDSPWSIISLIAGSLLIILTALQTAYTIRTYYQSKN